MFVTGISVYFTGFLVEEHSNRWNINTFMDSVIRSSLIFIVPFSISFIFNYRRALIPQLENSSEFSPDFNDNQPDSLITIVSQLKKENLVFYASQLIYAESDGNYVTFYLDESQHLRKEIVRNSMNNIEQQLSHIPFYMRTHRSFIVNLRKIKQNKGNALGYLVRLNGCDAEIPVSRQKIHDFKLQLNLFR
jgi:DNA-binding LytR/AlgR family response regulator